MALRVILHLDLDSFFASCEEQRNPALKGKPVVICNYTRGLDSGAVTTANYVARKLGIKSGMPVSFARRAAKNAVDAVFLPTDIDYYSQVSDQVMQLLQAYADAFEPASIDEAFLEVTQRLQGDFGKAEALGRELKARILEKTGLTCSVGIASNKLLAKTASDFRKPDGLTVVQPGREAEFLAPLQVGKLLYVGAKTEEVLTGHGIQTIGQLAALPLATLIAWFGESRGHYFHLAAQGLDDSPVAPPADSQQISRIGTLSENTADFEKIAAFTDKLCEDVIARARDRGVLFKSIGFIAVASDLKALTRNKTLEEPTESLPILQQTVRGLLQSFLGQHPGTVLRRAGVRVAGFVDPAAAAQPKPQKHLGDFV
ncbi:MAG TPA: DNA polymerase IV [Candidatus Diapherotrites archaeon]|uniref:DNA polymerase IV n=1 Tax=Candidatus Iainarchaeum sp. TaxID=3101447 RepID=A0A7J4JJ63_9ARCH|nr:DNA polymerase IV [Candidatus Diapherotrites archaeon]HIH16890.1 DNA polymerase IV [Candidatus Diapherotrites archaeon]